VLLLTDLVDTKLDGFLSDLKQSTFHIAWIINSLPFEMQAKDSKLITPGIGKFLLQRCIPLKPPPSVTDRTGTILTELGDPGNALRLDDVGSKLNTRISLRPRASMCTLRTW
jgi:hypothetical protein